MGWLDLIRTVTRLAMASSQGKGGEMARKDKTNAWRPDLREGEGDR